MARAQRATSTWRHSAGSASTDIGGLGLAALRRRALRREDGGVLLLQPVAQVRAAAVAVGHRVLLLAGVGAVRAADADVEMEVVPPHRPDLREPAPVAPRLPAQRDLDRRVDEDAVHARVARRVADETRVVRRPDVRVHVHPVRPDHVGRRHVLALVAVQALARHRRQPDVGVEPDLVRGVAGEHRPAAGLADVADQQPRPPGDLRRGLRQRFQIGDQLRVAPVAVAVEAHDLPGVAVHRKRRRAGEAAARIGADGARLQRGGGRVALAELHLGRPVRRVLQHVGAPVRLLLRRALGEGGRGAGDEQGEGREDSPGSMSHAWIDAAGMVNRSISRAASLQRSSGSTGPSGAAVRAAFMTLASSA